MTLLFFLSLTLFVLGALTVSKVKLSFSLGFLGSLGTLITGIYGLLSSQTIGSFPLLNNVKLVLSIDHLSAVFLIIAAVSWMALSLFSIDYSKWYPQKNISLGYNLSLVGMLLILTAHDGITLLMGWEIMTLFAFLMMLGRKHVYSKAYRFVAFGELSTVFLLLGFAALYYNTGSLSFGALHRGGLFVLVMLSLGFIIKMDIIPFHGWMKGAYSEIPDNTAALLSAPVTLMGVYGLERIIPLLPTNETWYLILILLGAFSAFWGSLQAVAATKIKLLPAYSTVENNGIILTAIGFYALANGFLSGDLHYLALFAQAASVVMVISHTFAKTLLFMSIGHAKEAYDVHTIDEARGVWSGVGRIPAIGIVISALSFSAFPPLIGYAGEWMVLETLFQSYRFPSVALAFFAALSGVLIALAIGLIGFAMIKLIGYTALGYDHERKSRPISSRFMHIAEVSLQLILLFGGIGLPFIIVFTGYHQLLIGMLGIPAPLVLASGQPVFGVISPTFIGIIMLVLFVVPLLIFLKRKKKTRKVNSWNGGLVLKEDEYFSAAAYSQILEHVLRTFYRTREIVVQNQIQIKVKDVLTGAFAFIPVFVKKLGKIQASVLMNGNIGAYVAYILVLFIIVFIIGILAI